MEQTHVVGSDTDVGKTYVSCGLLHSCRRQKIRVCGIKLIESGSEILTPETEDGYRLAQASGQSTPQRALIRLKHPVAPPLAAEREGVSIDWIPLVKRVDAQINDSELCVEGAGGLLSPLTDSFSLLIWLSIECFADRRRLGQARCRSSGTNLSSDRSAASAACCGTNFERGLEFR